MLTPTHIQVAVLHTKDLVIKGKNGTNDAYIIFSLGKEKFQSSIKEKSSDPFLEWNEGCDIAIPTSQGNKAELVLKVMHKASIGDKFLGRISLPLSEFDVLAKPKPIWYPLKPKPGNEKDTKYRGEIEVRIKFLIKTSNTLTTESAHDLAGKTKRKDSFRSSLGSILSLGKNKKKKKDKSSGSASSKDTINSSESTDSIRRNSTISSSRLSLNNNLPIINDDPGVISEEEEEVMIDTPPLEMKMDRKKSIQSGASIESEYTSDRANNSSSLPATPKNVHRTSLNEIYDNAPLVEVPPLGRKSIGPEFKFEFDEDDNTSKRSENEAAQMSPKPRVVRLPSVIVEESDVKVPPSPPPPPDSNRSDLQFLLSSSSPSSSSTYAPPPKLTVSASMINLTDGKGSVRKTFKSMFSSSKHLSVDEIFRDGNNNNNTRSSSNQSEIAQQQQQHQGLSFPGGFIMKKRNSARDLHIPKELWKSYERKSKEELVALIINLQETVESQKQKINDMEDYIDTLLLRVLDNMPSLLKKGNSVRE